MMARWMAVFGCTFALILAAPTGFDAHAQKKAKSIACAAKTMEGKQTKWRCKAGQKCCFNWLANKGGCVAASDICF
jgi:hypothetical protein